MGCQDKIRATCGKKTQAKCTKYEGTLSNKSTLEACDCLDVEEVIEDINQQLDSIDESLDLSSLEDVECMEYGENPTISSVLQAHAEKICELSEQPSHTECGCSSNTDPCDSNVSCCGAVVTGLKYWTGDLPLPTGIGSWVLHTGDTLKHTINSGAGYYRVILEHSVDFEEEGASMDVGLRVNLLDPTTNSTGFEITRMKQVYPKTIILYMNLKQSDTITPVYKRLQAGIIQFDIVKMMVEKIAYIPG